MRKIFTLFFCAASLAAGPTQQESYFTNPMIRGDVADPSIIRIDQTYYITGTSSEWAPYYPVFTSTDLVDWQRTGHVSDEKPEWTKSSFWAPEWYQHKGKVYVYYTAWKQSDNISCIGIAAADSPTGKFKDYGPVVEFGKEAIDAFTLEDKGKLYISWKAYGLDNQPIELLVCKLTDDGLRLDGKPFSLLRDDGRRGMEGQRWFKKDGYYYTIYSVRGCCGPQSDYAVSVARSKKLEGFYEKYQGNPILHGSKEVLSIGHGTITTTPDGRMYYLCYVYQPGSGFYQGRQPYLQGVRMGEGHWPHFVTGEYASRTQPMPFAESAQVPVFDFSDDFTGVTLRPGWSWNYPYTDAKTEIKNDKLPLSGTPKPGVETGVVLCLRPTFPDYTLETAIVNRDDSWKGVTMYGDTSNLITCGCVGDRLILKYILEGKEHSLADLPLPALSLYLRMKAIDSTHSTFYWGKDGQAWNEIVGEALSAKETRSLIQWDRISRPGLYQEGDPTASAIYAHCLLKNE